MIEHEVSFEPEDASIEELQDGPCIICDKFMLEEVENVSYECISSETGEREHVFISGIKCAGCGEIVFDEESAELVMNTMLRLDHDPDKTHRFLLTDAGAEKVSIH